MKPLLTIGCAVYDDFCGLWPTLTALRMYHKEEMPYCEIVVVDNNPNGRQAQTIKDFMGWIKEGVAGSQYVPLDKPTGTSAPRQRLFEVANGEAVLCMDSHILLEPGSIRRLLAYYAEHPDSRDLLQGPMVYDNLVSISTHWNDAWRSEMWGTWDTDLRADPSMPGYTGEPFEIFACGLGVFTCKKDAWLGFNPAFRGFGGEEGYIHEKFRRAGAKALCLPWFRWAHRFGRPDGVPYPLNMWHKVRNYVIGHTELGIPLDRLHRHFVLAQNEDGTPRILDDGRTPAVKFPESEWAVLMANPADPPEWPPNAPVADPQTFKANGNPAGNPGCCGGGPMDPNVTLDILYDRARQTGSDLNEHVPKLKELAAQVDHVTEFGMRRGVSTVALLAGQPKRLVSYDPNVDQLAKDLKDRQGKTELVIMPGNSLTTEIEETDLLFIDTVHKAEHFYAELNRLAPKVKRYIVRHDTSIYGETGEGGGPGLLPALRRFMKEQPEWSVVYHTLTNYGLTVLSRNPGDKPKLPSKVKMAWNYAKAKAAHLIHGSKILKEEHGEARLDVCSTCPQRTEDRCTVCGCFLDEVPEGIPGLASGPGRAWWAEQDCPLSYWTEVDQRFSLPMAEERK